MNSQNLQEPRGRLYDRYISSGSTGLMPKREVDLLPRLPYLRDIVRRCFPKDKHSAILDLGCGYGALVYAALREGYDNLTGVDTSAEQIAAAHMLGISQVSQADVFSYIEKQESNSYDSLIAFDILEHFTKPEIIRVIDEARRVLKPGGRFIVHVPNGESPFVGRILFGDFTHEQAFTQRSLTALFKASDFGEMHCYEDVPVPHGLKSIVRRALWGFIRRLLKFYIIVETGDTGRNMIFSQNLLAVAFKK
jgi:2-polyprenyl-3-methyl-5-hydroxy-6-metoxy-1,4-benzoquinol methylase